MSPVNLNISSPIQNCKNHQLIKLPFAKDIFKNFGSDFFLRKVNYSITRLNRKCLNRIFWWNVKSINFYFYFYAIFKPKLSLNQSKNAGPLDFGLTLLYCNSKVSHNTKRSQKSFLLLELHKSCWKYSWSLNMFNFKFWFFLILVSYIFYLLINGFSNAINMWLQVKKQLMFKIFFPR